LKHCRQFSVLGSGTKKTSYHKAIKNLARKINPSVPDRHDCKFCRHQLLFAAESASTALLRLCTDLKDFMQGFLRAFFVSFAAKCQFTGLWQNSGYHALLFSPFTIGYKFAVLNSAKVLLLFAV